jgi:hypothetical protein
VYATILRRKSLPVRFDASHRDLVIEKSRGHCGRQAVLPEKGKIFGGPIWVEQRLRLKVLVRRDTIYCVEGSFWISSVISEMYFMKLPRNRMGYLFYPRKTAFQIHDVLKHIVGNNDIDARIWKATILERSYIDRNAVTQSLSAIFDEAPFLEMSLKLAKQRQNIPVRQVFFMNKVPF